MAYLDILEKYLVNQKTKFLASDELTWADFVFQSSMERLKDHLGNLFESHPLLKAVNDAVINHPKIAAWRAKRPVTEF
jgi:glutathione S-transferase